MKRLSILGVRGIPAMHGGFETFAERLAIYLVKRGWEVIVYCQEQGKGAIWKSTWCGIKRVHVPVESSGSLGSVVFDWRSIKLVARERGNILTLGYNTALFCLWLRLVGKKNVINMDGIEWRRDKWGVVAKIWFWLNERIGCWVGDHLIADHPEIKKHLETRVSGTKISMIPYGGDEVSGADASLLSKYGLQPGRFSVVIARPEPENSILEVVRAFSQKRRNHTLVVLGNFYPASNEFHRKVLGAAGQEVMFPGAIYDAPLVRALRFHSVIYIHGHRVGGTNPSLVEALGAGCAVLAHDNRFNRWVAGPGAAYFADEEGCSQWLDLLLSDQTIINKMKIASKSRFTEAFQWPSVLDQYEAILAAQGRTRA